MTENRNSEPLTVLSWLLAVLPGILLAFFFVYVIQALMHLGYWPSYNHPDPKQLGWRVEHGLLQLGFISFPYAAGLAVVVAIIGRGHTRDFPIWPIIFTAIFTSTALIVLVRVDPGGFMDWFWD